MSGLLHTHLRYGELRDIEESQEVRPDRVAEVLRRVVTEWPGNKDARIIQQQIDPPECLNCGSNDVPGCFGMADIAVHELHSGCVGQLHCRGKAPRVCHDTIVMWRKAVECITPAAT